MTRSMTGYAAAEGSAAGWRWTWEIRSVNGRGLDIRLRLPDQIDGLEAPLRAAVQASAARGNVSVFLRLVRDETAATLMVNPKGLEEALRLLKRVEDAALDEDLSLRETSAAEVIAMRGVLETQGNDIDTESLRVALLEGVQPLLDEFNRSREREGAALESLLGGQIDQIAESVAAARALLARRTAKMAESLRSAISRLRDAAEGIDEARIAQELALIAIKADVAEELDRLEAHVAAARSLLSSDGPKGRKLDFLTQEFNREANTLCSKAQFPDLTGIGLDLKHTIDQMREQVQNVE